MSTIVGASRLVAVADSFVEQTSNNKAASSPSQGVGTNPVASTNAVHGPMKDRGCPVCIPSLASRTELLICSFVSSSRHGHMVITVETFGMLWLRQGQSGISRKRGLWIS